MCMRKARVVGLKDYSVNDCEKPGKASLPGLVLLILLRCCGLIQQVVHLPFFSCVRLVF